LNNFIDIVFTLFFLVPGFAVVKIHQSTREFRDLSAFEYTTLSIAQSFLVLLVWILWILFLNKMFGLHLVDDLRRLILKGEHELFFSRSLAVFLVTYLTAFLVLTLLLFNLAWTRAPNKLLRALGFSRFTEHLTPWEDFQILGQPHWILIELKDGTSISGKIAFGSHMPFTKELVLKRVDQSPIMVYDKDHKLVDYGQDIEMTYVDANEIRDIHMVKDEKVKEPTRPIRKHIATTISLVVSLALVAFFMMLLSLWIDHSYPGWPPWIMWLFPVAIAAVVWNVKSLGVYS
jgi:hypothetical protein